MKPGDILIAALCIIWVGVAIALVSPLPAAAAEWASAAATFLAVAVALWTSSQAHKQMRTVEAERRRDITQREVKRLVVSMLHVLSLAEMLKEMFKQDTWDAAHASLALAEYQDAVADLRAISAADLPDIHFAKIAIHSIGAANSVTSLMSWVLQLEPDQAPPEYYLDKALARIELRYEQVLDRLAEQRIAWK